MQQLVRVFFTRYPSGGDRRNAEVLFSEYMTREEYEGRRAALDAAFEETKCDVAPAVIVEKIEKLPRGARRNDFKPTGDIVYSNEYPHELGRKSRYGAGQRLCRMLERRDPEHEYHYWGRIEILPEGFLYSFCLSTAERMDDEDKARYLKAKVAGRKAAITRAINKAKAVRQRYRSSLFPDQYKSDPVYIRHLQSLPVKRARLHQAAALDPATLPDLKHEADGHMAGLRYANLCPGDRAVW
ncbi:hypothetical protein ACXWTF_12705 [Thiomicrolovo sp. ZZH C-3]